MGGAVFFAGGIEPPANQVKQMAPDRNKSLDETVITSLNQSGKRLIFTVTTGRSGTELLQRLFSVLPNVDALHEPEPKFSRVLRQVQEIPSLARDFLLCTKLPAIARYERPIYVETGHLFSKGFLEPALQLGLRFDLIVLRRSPRDVAKSLYELDTIPARTEWGRNFLLAPTDPDVLPLPGWENLHDYQLCYWYCLEIERRAMLYQGLVTANGGRVTQIDFSELLAGQFPRVLERLGLDLPLNSQFEANFAEVVASPVNAKREIKRSKARVPIDDYELLEETVLARLASKPTQRVA
jgi:hypothetical protein